MFIHQQHAHFLKAFIAKNDAPPDLLVQHSDLLEVLMVNNPLSAHNISFSSIHVALLRYQKDQMLVQLLSCAAAIIEKSGCL